ncbi:hypothetical protein FLONG3_3549 [Fusarium longipes]|uniref:Uncharacterized protein n=1 Tax=Fusarium longipes TaxID=694270 RepID=A0A395T0Y3_9HYPO|nr:hypothetical protein FLONG3_3549 [Fusarium longipes]
MMNMAMLGGDDREIWDPGWCHQLNPSPFSQPLDAYGPNPCNNLGPYQFGTGHNSYQNIAHNHQQYNPAASTAPAMPLSHGTNGINQNTYQTTMPTAETVGQSTWDEEWIDDSGDEDGSMDDIWSSSPPPEPAEPDIYSAPTSTESSCVLEHSNEGVVDAEPAGENVQDRLARATSKLDMRDTEQEAPPKPLKVESSSPNELPEASSSMKQLTHVSKTLQFTDAVADYPSSQHPYSYLIGMLIKTWMEILERLIAQGYDRNGAKEHLTDMLGSILDTCYSFELNKNLPDNSLPTPSTRLLHTPPPDNTPCPRAGKNPRHGEDDELNSPATSERGSKHGEQSLHHRRSQRDPSRIPALHREAPRFGTHETMKAIEEMVPGFDRRLIGKVDEKKNRLDQELTTSTEGASHEPVHDHDFKEEEDEIETASESDDDLQEFYISLPTTQPQPDNSHFDTENVLAENIETSGALNGWSGVPEDLEAVSRTPFNMWEDVLGVRTQIYGIFRSFPGITIEVCRIKGQKSIIMMIFTPPRICRNHRRFRRRIDDLMELTKFGKAFVKEGVEDIDIEIWRTNFRLVVVGGEDDRRMKKTES